MTDIIIRYAEIATKGKNRRNFELQLIENIRFFLKKEEILYETIARLHGRICITLQKVPLTIIKEKLHKLRAVFGIASFSIAVAVAADITAMKHGLENHFAQAIGAAQTFRIATQRLDEFPFSSLELNKQLGAFVCERFHKKVELEQPELTIGVELFNNRAYLFTEKIQGHGGLPVNSEGRVIAIIESQRSVLAALAMLKRGCKLFFVGNKAVFERFKSILENYLTYTQKPFIACASEEYPNIVAQLAKKQHCRAFVYGGYFLEQRKVITTIVELNPIALLTDKEVEEELQRFHI